MWNNTRKSMSDNSAGNERTDCSFACLACYLGVERGKTTLPLQSCNSAGKFLISKRGVEMNSRQSKSHLITKVRQPIPSDVLRPPIVCEATTNEMNIAANGPAKPVMPTRHVVHVTDFLLFLGQTLPPMAAMFLSSCKTWSYATMLSALQPPL